MLLSVLSGGDLRSAVIQLLLLLPVIMFSLALHETAHGYVAYKCGDPTAYNLGRLTLNPIKHLDPIGFLCMLIFGYGWAKPVPINTRNFRDPKKGMAWSAVAGPAANLLLGVVSAALFAFFYVLFLRVQVTGGSAFLINACYYTAVLFQLSAMLNFVFMIFNMIPVPPFDGSRFALAFLPPRAYFGIMKYERQIMFGLLIALLVIEQFFSFSPFSWLANKLLTWIANPLINVLAKFMLSI